MFRDCEGCTNLGKEDFLGNEVEGCLAGILEPENCILNKRKRKMTKIEQQNEGLKKQNRELQHTFFKVLKACEEEADCMHVVDFQKRIKAIINGAG